MPGRQGYEWNFIVFLCKNNVPNCPSLFRASTWNVSGIVRWLEYKNLNLLKKLLFFGEYYGARSPGGSSVRDGIDNASWWNILNFQCYHQSLKMMFSKIMNLLSKWGPRHQLLQWFRKLADVGEVWDFSSKNRSWGSMPGAPTADPRMTFKRLYDSWG